MTRLRFIIQLLILTTSLSCSSLSQQKQIPPDTRLAIRAARMLDVRTGQLVNDAVVLVDGGKIAAAGSGLAVPQGMKVVDLGDATLMPGLIDAHTHITYHFDENGKFGSSGDPGPEIDLKNAEENARLTLDAGFTTIRNLGAYGGTDIRLRDMIIRGDVTGPTMLVSGQPLTWYDLRGINKSNERLDAIRRFVAARVAEKVDVIKIFEGLDQNGKPIFPPEEIRAAVDEAKTANLKVAVHAHEAASIIAAVKGGCDSIEHGTFADDEAIGLMVKNHVALIPTLYLPTHYLEHRKQFAFQASDWEFFESLKSSGIEAAARARKKGVRIVNGSDAVAGLHGQNAREPEWLVKAGMSPAEAIRAATIDAAELLGLAGRAGELKPGFSADIIAVAGNPLTDIGILEKVFFVMKSGNVVKSK
jgi:imidazolonepropionase-like amidohydrolase